MSNAEDIAEAIIRLHEEGKHDEALELEKQVVVDTAKPNTDKWGDDDSQNS